jgi:hypothetical protein
MAPVQPHFSLSLEQHACIQAELDADPGRLDAVLATNGITRDAYEQQSAKLKLELSTNESQASRFQQLRDHYRAILGPR